MPRPLLCLMGAIVLSPTLPAHHSIASSPIILWQFEGLRQAHSLSLVAFGRICCSKHTPIEHRLFAHVTRECQGMIFPGNSW